MCVCVCERERERDNTRLFFQKNTSASRKIFWGGSFSKILCNKNIRLKAELIFDSKESEEKQQLFPVKKLEVCKRSKLAHDGA